MKKILILLMMLIIAINLVGCANATYNIGINSDGTFRAEYTISSAAIDGKGKIKPEILEAVKNEFEDAGYDVSVVDENGQENIVVSKEYVTVNANEKVNIEGVQINPMHNISNGARLTRGFMKNILKIDADIDLTALNAENVSLLNKYEDEIKENLEKNLVVEENPEQAEDAAEETPEITQEMIDAEKKSQLEKYLPEMNIKLAIRTKGKILNTNSTVISEDGKEASWMLIPGTATNVVFDCTTGFDKAFIGTAVILCVTLLLALFLAVYLVKIYFKQFKN